jgi:hypothetical protein
MSEQKITIYNQSIALEAGSKHLHLVSNNQSWAFCFDMPARDFKITINRAIWPKNT